MERRTTERFYIDLPADVCASAGPGAAEKTSRVQIRDINSAGAAFCDGGGWKVGEKVAMNIHVGNGIVGPFSYSLKARGHIVRKDFEENQGESVFAVAFDEGIRMSDWMDIRARTTEESKRDRRLSGGDAENA